MIEFTSIIAGEVLLAREDVNDRVSREPIRLSTDVEALATLPVMYIGALALNRVTDWNQGVIFGVVVAGSLAAGLATVNALENRGIIETI